MRLGTDGSQLEPLGLRTYISSPTYLSLISPDVRSPAYQCPHAKSDLLSWASEQNLNWVNVRELELAKQAKWQWVLSRQASPKPEAAGHKEPCPDTSN
jgi:hypothetical protein